MPASAKLRSDWRENLRGMAVNLSLYSGTSYKDALACPISDANEFFGSEAFGIWKKNVEASNKMSTVLIERVDGVTRAIGGLAKVLSKRR